MLWKHNGKRKKCQSPAFSHFPTKFSILSEILDSFATVFNLSSAHLMNLNILNFLVGRRPICYRIEGKRGPFKGLIHSTCNDYLLHKL